MIFNYGIFLIFIFLYIFIAFHTSLINCIYINEDEFLFSSSISEQENHKLSCKKHNETYYYCKPTDLQINDKNYILSTDEINAHSYENDIYDENYYSNSLNKKGVEFDLEIISGEVKIYRYLCKYTSCPVDLNSTSEDLIELFPILGYLSDTITANNIIKNLAVYKKYCMIVQCINSNNESCIYKIKYHKIENYKKLKNGQKFIKYIKNEYENEYIDDKYIIPLNTISTTYIDLIVYSGDAFFLLNDGTYNDYNFSYEIEDLGTNERAIFKPNYSTKNTKISYMNFENKIHIRSNQYGAIYYLYIKVFKEGEFKEQFPMEMTKMYSIMSNRYMEINFKSTNIINYYIVFNPINCDLKINKSERKQKENITTSDKDARFDYGITKSINYTITKDDRTNKNENKCLFMISSYKYDINNSYILLPESKPFTVILNSERDTARILFPFASSIRHPKILLRISLYSLNNIIVKIKVGSEEIEESISQTNDFLISKEKFPNIEKFTLNKTCPIIITLKCNNITSDDNAKTIFLDFNIKTLADVPYLIRSGDLFSDIVLNNKIQYYLAILEKNSTGFIFLNFKRGTGIIYGKVFKNTKNADIRDDVGNILFPKDNDPNLLSFNALDQQLVFNETITKDCNPNCYMIFGIKPNKINGTKNTNFDYENEKFFSEYSLILKYLNQDESSKNYIYLENDNFVIGKIVNNESDYYEFELPENKLRNKLIIDFQSENCKIELCFNNTNFSDKNNCHIFEGNGENQIFKMNISNFINKDINSSYNSNYLRIKIELKNSISNNFDTKYKLRLTAHFHLLENITTINTNLPIHCNSLISENNEYYSDFLINLNQFEYYEFIELYALSNEEIDNLEILAKIVDSDIFRTNMKNNTKMLWPDKNNSTSYNYSSVESGHSNILKFDISKSESLKILIRVYNKKEYNITLITNLIRKNEVLFPVYNTKQLMNVHREYTTITQMPYNCSYKIQLKSLEKNSQFSLHYSHNLILGYNDKFILNINKSAQFGELKIRATNSTNKEENNICLFEYSKLEKNFSLDEIEYWNKNTFAYEKIESLLYYFKVEKNGKNIIFNFIFNELRTNDKNERRDSNSSELFEIKGYLINEIELNELKTDNIKNLSSLKSFNGNYNLALQQANIIFKEEDLNTNSNESDYILIRIDKNEVNERVYNYISCTITVFSQNNTNKVIPSNIYITNSFFKNSTNSELKHYYNISEFHENRRMFLEFSSTSKDINIKIFNSIDKDNLKEVKVHQIKSQEEIGKHLIDINKTLENETLKNPILLVECTKSNLENNIFYTFRYIQKSINYTFKFNYEKKIQYQINKNNIKITINKIKNNQKNLISKCNYYARVYNNLDEDDNLHILTSFKEEIPILDYSILYNDNILNKTNDSFDIDLNITLKNNEKLAIDVIAEIFETFTISKEFLAYERIIPENDDEKKHIYYIIFLFCGIFLIFALILTFCICCYKTKNKKLGEQVKKISFVLGDGEEKFKKERDATICSENYQDEEEDGLY